MLPLQDGSRTDAIAYLPARCRVKLQYIAQRATALSGSGAVMKP